MKTFEVELKRESYITLTIEADSRDDAEAKAWHELEQNYPHINDSTWDINYINEVEEN
jgi:hypothetical protein